MNLKQAEKLIGKKSWEEISETPGLPESFIAKFADKVDWYWIEKRFGITKNKLSKKLEKEKLKQRKEQEECQVNAIYPVCKFENISKFKKIFVCESCLSQFRF